MEKTKLEARLEFLMSQLHQSADLKIKLETNRISAGWENPHEELCKAYKKLLERHRHSEVINDKAAD